LGWGVVERRNRRKLSSKWHRRSIANRLDVENDEITLRGPWYVRRSDVDTSDQAMS
jgi:hypothetical protein